MNSLKRILTIVLLALMPALAYAQNISKQESRKARLEKEIAVLDKQLNENSRMSRNALSELKIIQEKTNMRRQLIAESDAEIAGLNKQIRAKSAEIAALQERLDTLSGYYNRLVKAAYKNRDAKIWYMYILASDNLAQAFRRYQYFKTLSLRLKEQADSIRGLQTELNAQNEQLLALKSDAQIIRNARQKELNALKKEEVRTNTLVGKLKKDRKKYEKDLASKKRQVEALNREIEKLIAQAMKGGSTSGKASKPIDYTLAAEFSKNKGKLPWPAHGPVVDRFGQHYHPVFTKVKLPFNNGINIALSQGTAVKAVFDGEVKQIVVMPGYNKCVLVQHGNYFTFYCKLASCSVKAGDKVKTGQQIGVVDTINGETQLHFQVWQDKSPQNPETWLRPR